jgi:hypothetical protein
MTDTPCDRCQQLEKRLQSREAALRRIAAETYTDHCGDVWPTRPATIARKELAK